MLQIFFYCYKLGLETCKLQLKIEIDEIKIDDVEKCGYVINSIVTWHEFGHSDQRFHHDVNRPPFTWRCQTYKNSNQKISNLQEGTL